MTALYNELDPFAASWLRNLIAAGHIAPGVVDERSIEDLKPADVAGPGQRHFFAGIGVWSAALRLAGVPDDADVWTGSCPCQPFSGAGKRGGTSDARHLWPAWFALIEKCRPPVVFGEQVASSDGLGWLDLVLADMERCGYAVGSADLCAAGVGAPHIRQRLYFVAYADGVEGRLSRPRGGIETDAQAFRGCKTGELANDAVSGRQSRRRSGSSSDGRNAPRIEPGRLRETGRLGDAGLDGDREHGRELPSHEGEDGADGIYAPVTSGATRGFWSPADWIPCIDGFSRPVEPGTFPLAHGAPARVGRLRGYGNAIVRQAAAAFIEAAEAARMNAAGKGGGG